MTVHITVQGIITAAAFAAALIALAGYIFKARDWVKKQDAQDGKIAELRQHHEDDMKESREERQSAKQRVYHRQSLRLYNRQVL